VSGDVPELAVNFVYGVKVLHFELFVFTPYTDTRAISTAPKNKSKNHFFICKNFEISVSFIMHEGMQGICCGVRGCVINTIESSMHKGVKGLCFVAFGCAMQKLWFFQNKL